MRRELKPIECFIRAHDLHRFLPVDLRPLRELVDVRFLSLSSGTMGTAFANEAGAVIGINRGLGRDERRMVFVHELAHLLLEHPNSLWLCSFDGWFYSRYERQAQQAAALMLIPFEPLYRRLLDGFSLQSLTATFRSPQVLIETRIEMVKNRLPVAAGFR